MFLPPSTRDRRLVTALHQRKADLQLALCIAIGPVVQAVMSEPKILSFVVAGMVVGSVLWLAGALTTNRPSTDVGRAGWFFQVRRAVLLGSAQAATGCALILFGGQLAGHVLLAPGIALISSGLATPIAMVIWLAAANLRAGRAGADLEA